MKFNFKKLILVYIKNMKFTNSKIKYFESKTPVLNFGFEFQIEILFEKQIVSCSLNSGGGQSLRN